MDSHASCGLHRPKRTQTALVGLLAIPVCFFVVSNLVNYAFCPHVTYRFPPVDVVGVLSGNSSPPLLPVMEALQGLYLAHEKAYLTEVDTTVAAAPVLDWTSASVRVFLEGGPFSLSNSTFAAEKGELTPFLVLQKPTKNLTDAMAAVNGLLGSLYASAGLAPKRYLVSRIPTLLTLLGISRMSLAAISPAFVVSAGLLYTQFDSRALRLAVNVVSFAVLSTATMAFWMFYCIRLLVDIAVTNTFPGRHFYYALALDLVFLLLYLALALLVWKIIIDRSNECVLVRSSRSPEVLSSVYSDSLGNMISAMKTPSLFTQKSPANSPVSQQGVVVPQSLDPMALVGENTLKHVYEEGPAMKKFRPLKRITRSVTAPIFTAKTDILSMESEGEEKRKEAETGAREKAAVKEAGIEARIDTKEATTGERANEERTEEIARKNDLLLKEGPLEQKPQEEVKQRERGPEEEWRFN